MTQDVLAPFRRSGTASARPSSAQASATYRAFGVAGGGLRPLRLDMRPKSGLAVARLYSTLTEIAYERPAYTGILLIFVSKMVKLRGRNLRPVVEALLAGTCEYVAELGDGQEVPDGEPVIERIELVTPPTKTAAPQENA